MVYGYMRVSTIKQDAESQKGKILEYAHNNKMIIEKMESETISSRAKLEDRAIYKLSQELKSGDTLLIAELSRIGRSMTEVFILVDMLVNKKVKVIDISKKIEFGNNIQSKAILSALSLSAEIERDLISDRTKRGLAQAKANGKTLGRKKGSLGKSKLDSKRGEIVDLLKRGVSKASICKIVEVSRTGLDHWIKTRKIKAQIKGGYIL